MICRVCHREARGYAFRRMPACSMEHMNWMFVLYKKEHKTMDPTPNEKEASMSGMTAGWEYASSISKTDIATFTLEEATQFGLCITDEYTKKLAEFCRPPFPDIGEST